jgi:hypothetical protein
VRFVLANMAKRGGENMHTVDERKNTNERFRKSRADNKLSKSFIVQF